MKSKKKIQPRASGVEAWLLDPRAADYFKGGYALKLVALAAVLRGDNLSELARQRGLNRKTLSKHARAARKAFGLVDSQA